MVYKQFVDSSNLESVEYNTDTLTLIVTFKNNAVYKYTGVPEKVYNNIVNGDLTDKNGNKSVGATFIKLVKNGNYPYERLI